MWVRVSGGLCVCVWGGGGGGGDRGTGSRTDLEGSPDSGAERASLRDRKGKRIYLLGGCRKCRR